MGMSDTNLGCVNQRPPIPPASFLPPAEVLPAPILACLHGALYPLLPLFGHQGHEERDALGITGVPARAWPPLLLDLWLGTECAHGADHRCPPARSCAS